MTTEVESLLVTTLRQEIQQLQQRLAESNQRFNDGQPWPGASPADGGNAFLWHQKRELERAREKHPKPIISVHAAYGIILEELEEFWDEVKLKQRSRAKMAEELIQVAAMCQRSFEELELWKDYRPA